VTTDTTYYRTQIAYNDKRVEEQQLLFAYYNNNKGAILKSLATALGITFATVDLDDFQKSYLNIVTKTVDQLSIVYRDPAKRALMRERKEVKDFTEYYNERLWNVNSADKTASRYAKLCNTSLTYVYHDKGKIKYKIQPSWYYDIVVSDEDPYKIEKLSYQTYFGDTLYRVVWTDTEHYRTKVLDIFKTTTLGDREAIGTNKDMVNPYGIIPYAVLRLKEQGDFWGNGMSDLVSANEQINVILSELVNEHILMGGAGTILATNCKLATQKQDGTWTKPHVPIGRKHPIVVENASGGQEAIAPSLEYVSTNPLILELQAQIDWYIKQAVLTKGLNPNSFMAEVQDTSGLSKIMDAFEQQELRKDDVEPSRQYEDDRFYISVRINNVVADTDEGRQYKLKKIPEDLYLKVDFAEVKTYLTPDQQRLQDDDDLKKNKTNILKIMRRDNPDMDDETLAKDLEDNKKTNEKYLTVQQPIEPITEE
jgi:hypothetical protein